MDNIDKMVIDDMIKTAKEQLYILSPIICFFLILAGARFESTVLMLLGLIVILVFFVSLAVKKIQKEYDKRVNAYLELMKNADRLSRAIEDDNFNVRSTEYRNGDIDFTITDKNTDKKRVIHIESKYANRFYNMIDVSYIEEDVDE